MYGVLRLLNNIFSSKCESIAKQSKQLETYFVSEVKFDYHLSSWHGLIFNCHVYYKREIIRFFLDETPPTCKEKII